MCLSKHYAMMPSGVLEVKLQVFSTSTQDGDELCVSYAGCSTLGESVSVLPLDKTLVGLQNFFGRSGEDENLLPLSGVERLLLGL